MKTHFALSDMTACGVYVSGDEIDIDYCHDASDVWDDYDEYDPVIQHTADPDFVTCEKCKKHKKYLKFLEDRAKTI